MVRFDVERWQDAPVEPSAISRARRGQDSENDLWTVFNRIQENCIKGGQRFIAEQKDENGHVVGHRRQRVRAVKGVDQTVRLNQALWTLAEEMRNRNFRPVGVEDTWEAIEAFHNQSQGE